MFRKTPAYFLLYALLVFLFVFPKGGIKFFDIPLTWGYLLIGLSSLFLIFKKDLVISKIHFLLLSSWLPFLFIAFVHLLLNGTAQISYSFSFIISLFALPVIFYGLYAKEVEILPSELIFSFLKRSIFFLSCFGISLFFIKWLFGFFLEVPLLTTNLADFGQLEGVKCIDRGNIFKLISTYNNGNLYGVCLLMFTPLFYHIEKRLYRRVLLRVSFILTLSRTVWMGWILIEILYFFLAQRKTTKEILKTVSIFLMSSLGIFYFTSSVLNTTLDKFLLDITLGGRLSLKGNLLNLDMFSSHPFEAISEITYLTIGYNFGYIGLIAFLFAFILPFLIGCFHYTRDKSLYRLTILLGLLSYYIVSFSDGCLLLIPTFCFYLFLSVIACESKLTSYSFATSLTDSA